MTPGCSSAVNVLKKGPANILEVIDAGEQYVDPDFGANMNTIYWDEYLTETTTSDVDMMTELFDAAQLKWYNW